MGARRVATIALACCAMGFGGRAGPRIAADTLTAMPAAQLAAPLRTHVTTRGQGAHEGPAWDAFVAGAGGTWTASWDVATGVPSRVWGSGMTVAGAVASPIAAEAAARVMLAAHLALLAPGAQLADFELVSDQLHDGLRAVGFVQRAGGRRVVGGQIGFEFKHDRLFVISSSALPAVAATTAVPAARIDRVVLRDRATASLRRDLALPTAPVSAPGDELVLPLIADRAVLGYRVVTAVTIDGGADGRYLAYTDVATAEVIAVHQQNLYTTGTVIYRGLDRYPSNGRIDRPAPLAHVTLDATPQTTTMAGGVSWPTADTQTVVPAATGDLVTIVNMGSGGPIQPPSLTLQPDDQVLWDASATPEDDAQVQLYLDTNIVKQFVAGFAPDMPTLGSQLTVNANIGQPCNSYFDGADINMFHATAECENTGLVEDVVFHEFGHDLHTNEIIPGVGAFDGAMSEGAADFLAVNITEDPGMGRGFFYTNAPLRDLDPPAGQLAIWPAGIGEIHTTGLIFGESFWALRTAAIAQYGHDAGVALVLRLYVGALQRSTDIPSSLVETLATDDDDGDLTNGTPNECMIRDAFAAHGLRTVAGTVDAPGAIAQTAAAIQVDVALTGISARCTSDALAGATLAWKTGPGGLPVANSVAATATAGTPQFFAQLPLAAHGSAVFQAVVAFADGTLFTLPDNFADPFYQLYAGATVPLYCNDFEGGDPFAAGWTTAAADGSVSPWVWGVPNSMGATDPHAAYSGTHIVALGLGADYKASSSTYAQLPRIDVGNYSDVRLQYRRWLAVEDSNFDQARITANGSAAWMNASNDMGDSSDLQHIDREWRFHDVPLSLFFAGPTLDVAFTLDADPGLEYGGWQLDDVCVVANPLSICGDGTVSPTEECDAGSANAAEPDTCRPNCRLPACGDGILDHGEACDVGPVGDATCTKACELLPVKRDGGCDAGGGGDSVPLTLLGALLGSAAVRARRWRATRSRPPTRC